jgi:hypothetical protein
MTSGGSEKTWAEITNESMREFDRNAKETAKMIDVAAAKLNEAFAAHMADRRPVLGKDRNGKDVRKGDTVASPLNRGYRVVAQVLRDGYFWNSESRDACISGLEVELSELVTDSTAIAATSDGQPVYSFVAQPTISIRAPAPTLADFTVRVTAKVREMAPKAEVTCDAGMLTRGAHGNLKFPGFFAHVKLDLGVEFVFERREHEGGIDEDLECEMNEMLLELGARVMGKRP